MVEVDHFNLFYGKKQALHDISMAIPKNQVTALIGPSGCGKSTMLRSVNRLNDLLATVRIEGDIRLNGDSIYHARPSMSSSCGSGWEWCSKSRIRFR